MTKDQKIQNDSLRNPESLAKSYFKNSDITNLEPDWGVIKSVNFAKSDNA
jgi:hypothetical protein